MKLRARNIIRIEVALYFNILIKMHSFCYTLISVVNISWLSKEQE